MKMPGVYRQTGLTIIELVAVILISGIMAVGVVGFIVRTMQGVGSAAVSNQLASSGRIAINRIAMELHNALPNSIRATTATAGGDQCLEFIPIRAATSYINPPFTGSGSTTFDVVDFNPSQHGETGGYAVIFPNRQSFLYDGDNGPSSGWPSFPNRRPIQEIDNIADSASADQSTVTLVTTHRFRRRSPTQRFFVAEDPVSFCIVSDKLYRYTSYGFYQNQAVDEDGENGCDLSGGDRCLPNYTSSPDKVLITDSIDNSGLTAFTVGTQTLNRNSLISLEFNLTRAGESIRLNHEVLTRSVP